MVESPFLLPSDSEEEDRDKQPLGSRGREGQGQRASCGCRDIRRSQGQSEGGRLVLIEEHMDGPSWIGSIPLNTSALHQGMLEDEGWGQE